MKNLYLRIKDLILYFLHQEIIRFLIAGGINTIIGGILIPSLILLYNFESDLARTFIPLIGGYLIWFPFAYLIQVHFVFKTEFDIKRFFIYPTTQIPNYLINQSLLYIFRNMLGIDELIALVVAAIFAAPIMFVLVRLVVKKEQKGLF